MRSTPAETELSTWGATRKDSGAYTVTVTNPYGTQSATAQVTVIGKHHWHSWGGGGEQGGHAPPPCWLESKKKIILKKEKK